MISQDSSELPIYPDMEWMLVAACLIGAWAMLRIVGGERETRVAELQHAARQAADTPDDPLKNNSTN